MNEQKPENPQLRMVTPDELGRYLEARGAERPCEACGHELWEVLNPAGHLATSIGLILEGGIVRLPAPVIPTYAIACRNCSSMRMFSAFPILKWLKSTPP